MAGIKCIGILTSGGDAPGMTAAIAAGAGGVKSFPALEVRPDGEQHRNKACAAAQKIRDRFRKKNTVDTQTKPSRQPQRQRDDDDSLAKQREKNSLSGTSKRRVGGLSGKLQCHHKKSEKINVHGGSAGGQQGGV